MRGLKRVLADLPVRRGDVVYEVTLVGWMMGTDVVRLDAALDGVPVLLEPDETRAAVKAVVSRAHVA